MATETTKPNGNGRWTAYMKVMAAVAVIGALIGLGVKVINLSYSAGQTTQRVANLEGGQEDLKQKDRELAEQQKAINDIGQRVARLEGVAQSTAETVKEMNRKIDWLIREAGRQ